MGSVSTKISRADRNHDYFLYFRTKLGVTIAQVEDQKAYIKQLVSTEADSALIQQEKLVEHQLKKRQVGGNYLTGNNGLTQDFDTVKPVLLKKRPLKKRPKIGFQDCLLLNAGQKYCRMLHESILQYFRPSLSYHLSLRPLFCLYLSDRFTQGLLCLLQRQVAKALTRLHILQFHQSLHCWLPQSMLG